KSKLIAVTLIPTEIKISKGYWEPCATEPLVPVLVVYTT
ncbi:MAG: hypothetical protein ACI9WO_001915, partial [Sphingobacteriales bacterium]